SMPSLPCVEGAIWGIPEIKDVRVRSYTDANRRNVINMSYSGAGDVPSGGQIILRDLEERVEFRNLAIASIVPSESYVESTRPLMVLVERSIIDICDVD